jgi:23S rRNA pseudouridine1911/1915/1917 synthase
LAYGLAMDNLEIEDEQLGETVHTLTVEPSQAGSRLDRWLAENLPDLSRSRLQALIEEGALRAEGLVIRTASRKVKAGEIFSLVVPPPAAAQPAAQDLALSIVYEDDDLIVIDKPAGVVVHPAPGSPDSTLVNALLHHCAGSLSGIGGVKRPGIVHRIDKDTSGLLVAAKNDRAHHGLAAQFAEHSIDRVYAALCWGVPLPRQGQVEGAIGRNPADRKKMAIVAGGKRALTYFKVISTFGNYAALVECRLATGRTHQIRVHMTSIGHPLVGDQLYGKSNRKLSAPVEARTLLNGFPRQALHAKILGFNHPISGEKLLFESILPNDFKRLISSLETV